MIKTGEKMMPHQRGEGVYGPYKRLGTVVTRKPTAWFKLLDCNGLKISKRAGQF